MNEKLRTQGCVMNFMAMVWHIRLLVDPVNVSTTIVGHLTSRVAVSPMRN